MEDDDDIEWKKDPFDRPHRAEPESPEELLAMIQFEGTPALQGALRSLCREFKDISSTAVRSLPARVKPMVIEEELSESCLATDSNSVTIPRKNKRPLEPRLMHC